MPVKGVSVRRTRLGSIWEGGCTLRTSINEWASSAGSTPKLTSRLAPMVERMGAQLGAEFPLGQANAQITWKHEFVCNGYRALAEFFGSEGGQKH